MTNLNLQNYGVSNLETREMRTMNGGGSSLWYGVQARVVAMAEFALGLVEGFIECNCD